MGNCKVLDDLVKENDELKALLADTQHQLHKARTMNKGHMSNATLLGGGLKELKDENDLLAANFDELNELFNALQAGNVTLLEENTALKQNASLDGVTAETIDKLYEALGAVKNIPQDEPVK